MANEPEVNQPGAADDLPVARRVRVPIGQRDWLSGEFRDSIEVDAANADQWSANIWHARPPT